MSGGGYLRQRCDWGRASWVEGAVAGRGVGVTDDVAGGGVGVGSATTVWFGIGPARRRGRWCRDGKRPDQWAGS